MVFKCGSLFLAVISVLEAFGAEETAIWGGFDQRWERREFGFLTGHRVSQLSNYIDYIDGDSNPTANFGFSPGVDGDYSYPQLFYTQLNYGNGSNGGVILKTDSVLFKWSDNATIPNGYKYPIANHSDSIVGSIAGVASDAIGVIHLNGFNLTTFCNASETQCNSNGIWPYFVQISVDTIAQPYQTDNNEYKYEIKFSIARTTSPNSEGVVPKPFNYRMHLRLEISFVIWLGQTSSVTTNNAVVSSDDTLQNFDGIQSKYAINGDPNISFNNVATVIQRFQFTLKGWENKDWPLGRYFEGLQFSINDDLKCNDGSSGDSVCNGSVQMNVFSARTVYPCDLSYEMKLALIQMSDDSDISVVKSDVSKGVICVSGDPHSGDLLFDCDRKGLPEQTSDVVTIFG